MASRTHYQLLEVARTAGVETIRAAHAARRAQARAMSDTPETREHVRALDAAFVVLADPQLRSQYDARLAAEDEAAARAEGGGADPRFDDASFEARTGAAAATEGASPTAAGDGRTERERALAYLERPRADLAREALLVSDWAGFWRRLVAGWIDSIVLYIPYVAAGALVLAIGTAMGAESGAVFGAMAAVAGVLLLYHTLFIAGRQVATPGRMALGIAVVDADTGVPIGAGRAFARSLLSALGYVLIVPNLFALFTARKQSVADLATNSAVVIYRPGGGAAIAVAALLAMVVVMGILAAIAIPAYQDYVMRARIGEIRRDLADYAHQVEQHVRSTGRVPPALKALPDERQTRFATYSLLPDGTIVADVTDRGTNYGQLALRPQYNKQSDQIRWVCVSDGMRAAVRPRDCPQVDLQRK